MLAEKVSPRDKNVLQGADLIKAGHTGLLPRVPLFSLSLLI